MPHHFAIERHGSTSLQLELISWNYFLQIVLFELFLFTCGVRRLSHLSLLFMARVKNGACLAHGMMGSFSVRVVFAAR